MPLLGLDQDVSQQQGQPHQLVVGELSLAEPTELRGDLLLAQLLGSQGVAVNIHDGGHRCVSYQSPPM
ncbi:hypothetical protein, partial [Pseudomonas aeruginosa]|uniref:hypothetical protein n=1 Tax=Pseudomonas aeruginosa TaxID=287 RepID=UPI0030F0D7D3